MTIRIETDNNGKDVIWSELAGKAIPLPVENLFIRACDGHCFVAGPAATRGLEPLRPHEVEMVEFWLREKAPDIAPNVFAGEPAPGG